MDTTKTVIYNGSGEYLGFVKISEQGRITSILPKGAEVIGEMLWTELKIEILNRLQFGGRITFKCSLGKKHCFVFREAKGIHALKLTTKELLS